MRFTWKACTPCTTVNLCVILSHIFMTAPFASEGPQSFEHSEGGMPPFTDITFSSTDRRIGFPRLPISWAALQFPYCSPDRRLTSLAFAITTLIHLEVDDGRISFITSWLYLSCRFWVIQLERALFQAIIIIIISGINITDGFWASWIGMWMLA